MNGRWPRDEGRKATSDGAGENAGSAGYRVMVRRSKRDDDTAHDWAVGAHPEAVLVLGVWPPSPYQRADDSGTTRSHPPMSPAISVERWAEAQQYEREYWEREARNCEKLLADVAEGHHFTKGVLDIRPAEISVLDIAGGPYPIGAAGGLDLLWYIVLDPGDYPDVEGVERVRECAEDYRGGGVTEVWGYNVLQHVRDPAAVMATARRCALERIRWFDVVDTPVYPVHPHSVKADWLRAEMSKEGFTITRDIDGSRLIDAHIRQKFVALVAERV